MPREIKAPIRYIMEDITPVRRSVQPMSPTDSQSQKPKRGRPRSVGLIGDPATPALSSRPSPRKSSESIIILDDDDSDLEIIEPPKPSKRKKGDDDPDWGMERKSRAPRSSRVQDRGRREKLQSVASPPVSAAITPTASVASKGQEPQKPFIVDLFLECKEEPLSLAQLNAMKKEQAQYELSQSLVKAAREGRLIFLPDGGTKILDKPMVFTPQTPVIAPAPPRVVAPQSIPTPGVISHTNLRSRSQSPDLLIVGKTPPQVAPLVSPLSPPAANVNKGAPGIRIAVMNKVAPTTTPPPVTLVQGTHGLGIKLPTGWQMVPVTTSATPAAKDTTLTQALARNASPKSVTSLNTKVQSEVVTPVRPVQQPQQMQPRLDQEAQKKKLKKQALPEEDESGNWVPLDEYYYGKMEGDPTYQEAKGEHRFKCWYCNKMLYNNVAAMMHIQGHIDSERQVNLDLSDLTQCKHCYKQFDTPFEMQTHIEKVHMNNANVLLCRICERNHDSRQALKEHMRKSHNACEMPYICQLCKFRSSMYSDVVDHFKKKHNGSDAVLCMYCLRVFHIRFVNQGWGQTSVFYNHLMKHQVKNSCKKCQQCRLVFLNLGDVKMHRKLDHLPNQKGVIGMNAKYTTPDQVMIKVTEKTDLSLAIGGVKSLNVPAVKKIMEHRLSFPPVVSSMKCIECQTLMGIPDHYRKFIQCSMCRFATSCSFAYSNHMMGFHSGQMTAAASHTPDESKLEAKLYCSCGFVSNYGNRIANHLVFCSKSSCFKDPPPPCAADEFGQELQDPRKKPDASLLDVLGLIKKDSLTPLSARTPHLDSPPSEPVEMPDVSLSSKLGKKSLLLRDSLKKTFKSMFKSDKDKDKNIFERVRFGDDSLVTEKQGETLNLPGLKRDDLKKVRPPVTGETSTKDEDGAQAKSVVKEEMTVAETTDTNEMAIESSDVVQQSHVAKTSLAKPACDVNEILKSTREKKSDSTDNNHSEGNEFTKLDCRKREAAEVANLENESAKIEDMEIEFAKIDDSKSESAKIDDMVSESVEADMANESTKVDDQIGESTKAEDKERESSKVDDMESESTKVDDMESESAEIDYMESNPAMIDDTKSESSKIGDAESESTKIDDMENGAARIDDMEAESTRIDDIESEAVRIEDAESGSSRIDNVESELTKNADVESQLANNAIDREWTENHPVEYESDENDVGLGTSRNVADEIESPKSHGVDSESFKNDETELARNDDSEIELSKNHDYEKESAKNDDLRYESPVNVDVGPARKEETDIEPTTNVSLEDVKSGDTENESNLDGEYETAGFNPENMKDSAYSDSGNTGNTDGESTSEVLEQQEIHLEEHEGAGSHPGLDKYEHDAKHGSCTAIAESEHDSVVISETNIRDSMHCDNDSYTKISNSGDTSAAIVSQDIEDSSAHLTSVLSGQAGVDDEGADDEQSQYLGFGDTSELSTSRDKVSKTDVLASQEISFTHNEGAVLGRVSEDLKPLGYTSAQPYPQENTDKDNSSDINQVVKSSLDSHPGSEGSSKPAGLGDSLGQEKGPWTEEPNFTSSDGNVGASSKEGLFCSQSGMSQNSCVSQEEDKSQVPGDKDGSRLSSSILSSAYQKSKEETSCHQETSPSGDLNISHSEELLTSSSSQHARQAQSDSDLQRGASSSSSAQGHSRSDRGYHRRSRSRSQDTRRQRRSRSPRDRDHDQDRHRNRDRDRHRDRRSRSRDRDRHDDRDRYNRDRHRDRSQERDRHRDRSRDRNHSREVDRSRDRDRNRDRDYQRYNDDRRYR